MACFTGLYGVAMGLIFGIIFALFSLVIPSATLVEGAEVSLGFFKWIFGVGAIIFLPIFYGIFGFLAGLIFTPIMNLILRMIKGIDLDIEMSTK